MTRGHWQDLLGYGRLAAAGVIGATDAAESLHAAIGRLALPLGRAPPARAHGVAGVVYGSIRGVTRLVDRGLELAAGAADAPGSTATPTPAHEAWRAAVNGVFGDRLVAAGNPLAIPMRLRRDGRPLALTRAGLTEALPSAGARALVLVHGLCRNDLQWRHAGHDHGEALERDLGFTRLYLHYNSGRPIAANGAELARLLETLALAWPVPLQELTLVGHSMGGLVMRSAVAAAQAARLRWPATLRRGVFLGTPHRGATWARLGHGVETVLGLSPYAAPFARIGAARSAGIHDLRHGDATPLPAGVDWHAVGATLAMRPGPLHERVVGDGLVPLDSALGRAASSPATSLGFEPHRQWVARGTTHIGLLGREGVYPTLAGWLAGDAPARRRARPRAPTQRGSGKR